MPNRSLRIGRIHGTRAEPGQCYILSIAQLATECVTVGAGGDNRIFRYFYKVFFESYEHFIFSWCWSSLSPLQSVRVIPISHSLFSVLQQKHNLLTKNMPLNNMVSSLHDSA